jgi:AcrR family transcriptional regulator
LWTPYTKSARTRRITGIVDSVHEGEEARVPDVSQATRRYPHGQVRQQLIAAGLELARAGGPDAVVLREATRQVGVAPNAAYRHFADRDALLKAVCVAAMRELAIRMEARVAGVDGGPRSKRAAMARLNAIGTAYLEFAVTEPGLFRAAFAMPRHLHYAASDEAAGESGRGPLQLLGDALDALVRLNVLPAERRPDLEIVVWASVHGIAVLATQGPLRELPEATRDELFSHMLAWIQRAL